MGGMGSEIHPCGSADILGALSMFGPITGTSWTHS